MQGVRTPRGRELRTSSFGGNCNAEEPTGRAVIIKQIEKALRHAFLVPVILDYRRVISDTVHSIGEVEFTRRVAVTECDRVLLFFPIDAAATGFTTDTSAKTKLILKRLTFLLNFQRLKIFQDVFSIIYLKDIIMMRKIMNIKKKLNALLFRSPPTSFS